MGMHHAWTALFVTLFLTWQLWLLGIPVALWLGRKYPPVRLRPYVTWLVHAAACLLISIVSGAWIALLDEILNPWARRLPPPPFMRLWRNDSYNAIWNTVFCYAFVLCAGYIVDSRERFVQQRIESARLNERFSKMQLDVLRRQIEPHFLFNALNAVAGLIRENRTDAAVNMLVKLSEFLRKAVEDSGRQEVPLSEELQFMQMYLDIQKIRFADRLQISLDIPEKFLPILVPSLILQPIVENAVKHGIAKQARGKWIRVSAFRSNGSLTLRVYNDGPNLPEGWETRHSGTGISNVQTRLQNLYGEGSGLSLRNHPGGVEASVSLPYRER
jgi:sensor histidine kinase YesM